MEMVVGRRRPRGVFEIGLSCIQCAMSGRREHLPTGEQYPDSVVRRISFEAGGGLGWRLSALWTPRDTPPPWKIVVVTGAPSWAEYWAPVMAALPPDREMVIVDRPGFANSEPFHCVPKLETQAQALLPLMDAAPGQRILLVGQSYGAAIATMMAAARPENLGGLVQLSGYFGQAGPTARFLVDAGMRMLGLIPRDLKHAVMEVAGQRRQLDQVFDLLKRHPFLTTFIHGDEDDFAPIETARALAETTMVPARFVEVRRAGHFLNDGPADQLLACLEAAIRPQGALRQVRTIPKLATAGLSFAS